MGALIDALVTFGVLFAIFVIAYTRITQRTLGDLIKEVKESLTNEEEILEIH